MRDFNLFRRNILRTAGLGAAAAAMGGVASASSNKSALLAAEVLFNVRQFGATGNGKTLDTVAINLSIEACSRMGGGIVYLPPGTYLSGTVILKSNVTFYLEAGAVLLGSVNIDDFTPQAGPAVKRDATRWELPLDAKDAGQHKHLMFASDAENVTLAGPGKIDGQGPAFWAPSGRKHAAPEDLWKDHASDYMKSSSRPSPLLEFVGCQHLKIQDIQIENAPGWTLRSMNCSDVFIDRVTVKNPIVGPNSDGLDICNSKNVFISNCSLTVSDDIICLKSENPYGESIPVTKNVVITNCVMSGCCAGLKIGTATRGGFENISFSNSVIFNDDVKFNERVIAGVALTMVDGGWVSGVTVTGIRMERVRTPIFIRRGNRTPRQDGTAGTLKDILIDGINATGSILTSSITGLSAFPVENVSLSNIRIQSDEPGKEEWANLNPPELDRAYPEAQMFGRLPSFGLYCRHVSGLRIKDVVLSGSSVETRPAICLDDGKGVDISSVRSPTATVRQPVIKISQSENVWLRDSSVPPGGQALASIDGEKTRDVLVSGCDIRRAQTAVVIGPGTSKEEVTFSNNSTKSPA